VWDGLSAAQRTKMQAAAEKAIADYTAKFNAQEREILDYFKAEGKKVYVPDVAAFRSYAQKKYQEKYGHEWPKGALERINAIS
jgi:TRAP-type C4-dicarboxylate transport system substrate-binding protein